MATATSTTTSSSSSSQLSVSRAGIQGLPAQFREIHKNTWLKRLTAEGKKITVGPKKSERSWVVFCVHDDTEAILEGYAEPRQAASHNPEWFVSMQNTQHISHALIPNSNEFEFVVTLSNEVVRFHAMSWEIMQEWVETLRSKLREMKILSPRENLYTKLPEARPPLLPTRDPTSPLPAPPPVPAAIVPGVELVVPQSVLQASTTTAATSSNSSDTATRNTISVTTSATATTITSTTATITTTTSTTSLNLSSIMQTTMSSSHIPAMSNTLTQNLLNMLSDPISAYSEQLQAVESRGSSNDIANIVVNEQLSTSLNDLQLVTRNANENEDCLSPLLRPASRTDSRNDIVVGNTKRHSADHARNVENDIQCDRLISRSHTSRSQSVGAADKTKNSRQSATASTPVATTLLTATTNKETLIKASDTNITALEITTTKSPIPVPIPITTETSNHFNDEDENMKTNITIIQVSTDTDCLSHSNDEQLPNLPLKINATQGAAEIFQFPETNECEILNTTSKAKHKQTEYKSNVQLIPSSNNVNSSTIKVLGDVTSSSQYSTPIKKSIQTQSQSQQHQHQQNITQSGSITQTESNQITTVHVGGTVTTSSVSVYGTCYTPPPLASPMSTPKLPKKVILSANTSGITNITVDSNASNVHNKLKTKENTSDVSVRCNMGNVHYEKVFLSTSTPIVSTNSASSVAQPVTTIISHTAATSAVNTYVSSPTTKILPKPKDCVSPIRQSYVSTSTDITNSASLSTSVPTSASKRSNKAVQTAAISITDMVPPTLPVRIGGSPALQRRSVAMRPANMLKRGQTEAVITRPSRRDFYFNNGVNVPKTQNLSQQSNRTSNKSHTVAVNNNENGESNEISSVLHAPANHSLSDLIEQRRRSSSTSDARGVQRSTRGCSNNNEFAACNRTPTALRIQQPPQPFRNVENSLIGAAAAAAACMSPAPSGASASKRMTLREQQVMQLRREIMHPGGVRLQLRRKDCIGSIAWVEAFGAVWVAGWKQKEHPVLYNALHIGDQLLSIAGVTISSPTEANKIIRNANTLFVEVLIRRMPFGRGYAIRRDREGQCLGLIRDGNTATIVDVVPNSLAARHGLPPKAQSCDGTLTFWVLTEINGRPLNLFFKENEIRDRLNSVGRDISILVQPSDLITKLKKQLKSLRGYKDYLVQ